MTKAKSDSGLCPVCGIDQEKGYRDLTQNEKRTRRAARHIRLLAMLHLVFAGILFMRMGETEHRLAMAVIAIINLVLAVGLIRYDFRAYRIAVVCYFGFGIVNVISIQHGSVHLGGIALALIVIYIVGNRMAKAIFERRLPEEE